MSTFDEVEALLKQYLAEVKKMHERNKKLKEKLEIAIKTLEKIKGSTGYAGTATKEISDYLLKQAGYRCPELAEEALLKLTEE